MVALSATEAENVNKDSPNILQGPVITFTNRFVLFFSLFRQICDAGTNDEYLKDVRKAAFESSRAAIRRLSVKCAAEQSKKSLSFLQRSRTSQKSESSKKSKKEKKKKKGGSVLPDMRFEKI